MPHLLPRLRAYRHRLTPRLLWDLLMVYLAFLNVGLILFDLTYLGLRPFYQRSLPPVSRLYDPVKGIGAHALSQRYLELADAAAGLASAAAPAELEAPLAELRELSPRLLGDESLERTGQLRNLIRLRVGVEAYLSQDLSGSRGASLASFWSAGPDLTDRLAYFNRELRPLIRANYSRQFDRRGRLVDHFWLLDLPFLTLFAIEFFTRWVLAIRRTSFARWYLFPIFNWYDLLGIVPVRELRVFRLFRIASIYIRLRRSELTSVGDDIVSRIVQYFANIISEEISDLVAVRILSETQEEIRDGTHRRIVRTVARHHRDSLTAELSRRAAEALSEGGFRERAHGFLEANLELAVESAQALRRLPVPDALLRPLVQTVGQTVFDSFADTLQATLASPEGQEALERIVGSAVDGLVEELTEGELEAVVKEIALEVLEHMKEAVAVRKWALPDVDRGRPEQAR